VSNVASICPRKNRISKSRKARRRIGLCHRAQGKKHEYDVSAYGEELLFSVASRFLAKDGSCKSEIRNELNSSRARSSPFRKNLVAILALAKSRMTHRRIHPWVFMDSGHFLSEWAGGTPR